MAYVQDLSSMAAGADNLFGHWRKLDHRNVHNNRHPQRQAGATDAQLPDENSDQAQILAETDPQALERRKLVALAAGHTALRGRAALCQLQWSTAIFKSAMVVVNLLWGGGHLSVHAGHLAISHDIRGLLALVGVNKSTP